MTPKNLHLKTNLVLSYFFYFPEITHHHPLSKIWTKITLKRWNCSEWLGFWNYKIFWNILEASTLLGDRRFKHFLNSPNLSILNMSVYFYKWSGFKESDDAIKYICSKFNKKKYIYKCYFGYPFISAQFLIKFSTQKMSNLNQISPNLNSIQSS